MAGGTGTFPVRLIKNSRSKGPDGRNNPQRRKGGKKKNSRKLKILVVFGGVLPCFALIAAIFSFVIQIRESHRHVNEKLDAIVVFSGAPERITAASYLINSQIAPSIFFAGQDNTKELESLILKSKLSCCIQYESSTKNTVEDAKVIGDWVKAKSLHSLVLVTTDYHVPRAMIELRRELPNARIRPFGVTTSEFNLGMVWHRSDMARIFLSQFIKFVVSSLPRPISSFRIPYWQDPLIFLVHTDIADFAEFFIITLAAIALIVLARKVISVKRQRAYESRRDNRSDLADLLLGPDRRRNDSAK